MSAALWRVWITDSAERAIVDSARASHPAETGGVLLGVLAGRRPWITLAVEVPSSRSTGTSYYLSGEDRVAAVNDQMARSDLPIAYLGEWHSHPADVGPSNKDKRSMRCLASDQETDCDRPVLLIARRCGSVYELNGIQAGRWGLRRLRLLRAGPPQAGRSREAITLSSPTTRLGSMSVDLRALLVSKQEQLHVAFEATREAMSHPGAKGDASEAAWRKTIEEFLPQRYKVSTGFAVDADGESSEQLDAVIHDRHYCPLLFESGGHLYIPAESVYAVFEIKPEISKTTIGEASGKVASVRRLRRTSADIPHQGGIYAAPEPARILGGILAGRSSWADPLGDRLEHALSEASEQLDLGCTFADGAFEVNWDSGEPDLGKSDPDVGLIFFLMRLFTRLREMRTVPAIDLEEYARTLEQNN